MIANHSCPHCQNKMESLNKENTEFEACSSCAGMWFDLGELKEAISWQENNHFELKTIVRGDGQPDHAHGYICPKCEIIMEERQYAYDSGIHIDGCPCCRGIFVSPEYLGAIGTFLHSSKHSDEAKIAHVDTYKALNKLEFEHRNKQEALASKIDGLFKFDDIKGLDKLTNWLIGELVDVDSFKISNR